MTRDKSLFHFKQFSVKHTDSPLKVTTDAVLLGAWSDFSSAMQILDIGAGNGILSLIAAQRNNIAKVFAVEIDKQSSDEARYNFDSSKWNQRLRIIHTDINDFEHEQTFDVIVSNPPYFRNSLLNCNITKAKARHTLTLTYESLLKSIDRLLLNDGKAHVAIPFSEKAYFLKVASIYDLNVKRETHVSSQSDKTPYLCLLQLVKHPVSVLTDAVYLYESDNAKSDFYRELTADLYL